jgi:hypothetical protein
MQMDAKGMHDELMALLLNNPDLTNSDTSSLVRKFRIVLLKETFMYHRRRILYGA